MSQPTVVPFTGGNVQDIPRQLEVIAQELRQVDGRVQAAFVARLPDGTFMVCGLGQDADELRTIGLLHAGAGELSEMFRGRA